MAQEETLKAYLKRVEVKNAVEQAKSELMHLPVSLRHIGYALLELDQDGSEPSWQEKGNFDFEALGGERFAALDRSDQQRLLDALHPQISTYILAGWDAFGQHPYISSNYLMRAPNRPEWFLVQQNRLRYIHRITEALIYHRDQSIVWFAEYGPYIRFYLDDALTVMLCATINMGDAKSDQVLDALMDIGQGNHPQARVNTVLIRTLLASSRPEGWEFVEQLLLAAQRQEGVRQSIFDALGWANIDSLRRLLALINEEKLVRFNSVISAADTWFRLDFDATQTGFVSNTLIAFEYFLNDIELALRGVQDDDPHLGYLALISIGVRDLEPAIEAAQHLINTGTPDQRLMATKFLILTYTPSANHILASLLGDHDEHVSILTLNHLCYYQEGVPENIFDITEKCLKAYSNKEKVLESRIWPWLTPKYKPESIGKLLELASQNGPADRLIPYLHYFPGYRKRFIIRRWFDQNTPETWTKETRQMVIGWLGDRSTDVQFETFKGVTAAKLVLNQQDIEIIEGYLSRKGSDLRRMCLSLLFSQHDALTFASMERLLVSGKAAQRQAGIEMLLECYEAERHIGRCRQLVADFKLRRKKLTKIEKTLLNKIPSQAEEPIEQFSPKDGFGLINHTNRTPPHRPQNLDFVSHTDLALYLIQDLDQTIEVNKDVEIEIHLSNGNIISRPLGNLFTLSHIDFDKSKDENRNAGFLHNIWISWWKGQQQVIKTGDGYDLVRAYAIAKAASVLNDYQRKHHIRLHNLGQLYPQQWIDNILDRRNLLASIFEWLLYIYPQPETDLFSFALDGVEQTYYHLMSSQDHAPYWQGHQINLIPYMWEMVLDKLIKMHPEQIEDRHHIRLWLLRRWRDEPTWDFPPPQADSLKQLFLGDAHQAYTQMPRKRAQFDELMEAFTRGGANEDDILDALVGPPIGFYKKGDATLPEGFYYPESRGSIILHRASGRQAFPQGNRFAFHPAVQDAIEKIRSRVFQIELKRGDLPTPISSVAKRLRYSGGIDRLIELLTAFGKENFVRGYAYDGLSKRAVYSHLIRVTYPDSNLDRDQMAGQLLSANIPEKRLIETAMYAPQWAAIIGQAVGWDGLEDGVWWFHAHTKERNWNIDSQLREAWAAEINTFTPLTGDDLIDGAVDVAWFKRIYITLGTKRWAAIADAAKYASGTGGHKRAQLFADAMLGVADQGSILKRITTKRYQDGVRAMGLFPLPEESAEREHEILERYLSFQEFRRSSRQFGSQRQASEALAIKIGMENLARTAGFSDPLRLEWAMEKVAIADLVNGPIRATHDDVTVTLEIDRFGNPQVAIERMLKNGTVKTLKAVPAKVKKVEAIAFLIGRKAEIRKQASRTRQSLEQAMIKGDRFSGAELADIYTHPVLKPMLQQIVFIRESDGSMGYPVMAGTELEGIERAIYRLESDDRLRIAHPHDFLTHDWHIWQRECFRQERIQPFKQIFRELYVVTPVEAEAGDVSRRYAGQEVNPRQALGLFSQRGWVTHYERGTSKTFHDEKIRVEVGTLNGIFTPADIGGNVIETVRFFERGSNQPLKLDDLPPRLFSEVMRDLDLVVSVAYLGGVDPEASASSIEVRAGLARETANLLQLNNVTLKKRHILIEGQLNSYSVHLGSGIIHQRPGGYVCIVPVHNSQRGRIFLPFVDKDPKSAEIIAKMVMLANDQKIQDPTILEQLMQR